MASVSLTPIAESDLVQIWLYVATNSEESTDRLLTRFEHAFGQLAEHPPEPALEEWTLRHGRQTFREPARPRSVMSLHTHSFLRGHKPRLYYCFVWLSTPTSASSPLAMLSAVNEFPMNPGLILNSPPHEPTLAHGQKAFSTPRNAGASTG